MDEEEESNNQRSWCAAPARPHRHQRLLHARCTAAATRLSLVLMCLAQAQNMYTPVPPGLICAAAPGVEDWRRQFLTVHAVCVCPVQVNGSI
jgi:hypothetical protein